MKPDIRFTADDANKASEAWGFNCGPGALCAVMGMAPEELRPHLLDFEEKRYTNPMLMFSILDRLKVRYQRVYRSDDPLGKPARVDLGLMRIQWGGPWCKPGVPMQARYRQTHWCALAERSARVFDVNAVDDGWVPYDDWATKLIPGLIKDCVEKSDGLWWPTHVIEIFRK